MYKNISRVAYLLVVFFFSSSSYAADNAIWKNMEISGAGGVNWLNTDDTHLEISSFETDTNRVSSTSVDGAWKFGVGYYFFVNRLLLELNVYGASNTVKGDVWQYELPEFNNYTFSAPLSSTRLMLDVKPSLITWNKLTPYLILGVGATWNTASYDEEANPGTNPAGVRSLSDKTQTQLAWDVGAGIGYALTDNLSITAEYVYAFLGDATAEANATVTDAPSFSYQIQTLLFGLSIKL